MKDEYGFEYEVNNEPVGEEDLVELDISFKPNIEKRLIESALRISPPAANLSHLTRLSVHKHLGSSEQDRAILLHDYAASLRPYSDFVVYLACKSFWETGPSPFFPKISPIIELCELLHQSFKQLLENFDQKKALETSFKPKKYDKSQWYDGPKDNPIRRELCDFLISKGEPDYFEVLMGYSNYQLELLAKGKYGYGKDA